MIQISLKKPTFANAYAQTPFYKWVSGEVNLNMKFYKNLKNTEHLRMHTCARGHHVTYMIVLMMIMILYELILKSLKNLHLPMQTRVTLRGHSTSFWLLDRFLGPRWPQDGPRWPKMAQDGPKVAQDGPKLAQDGPKLAPRWPNMGHRPVLEVAFDR